MAEALKKVTVTLPAAALERAQKITGLGLTETIRRGLEALEGQRDRAALRALRGRVRFELDLSKTRR
jgi:hypothetical protein